MARDELIKIAEGFWNIRGSHKIAGLLDVGTQSSLARLSTGRFVLLDAYTLEGKILEQVMGLTDNGEAIEAVLHLHPFHTIHVEAVAKLLPDALQYGTRRHVELAPEMRWESLHTNDEALHARYAKDFIFSVPQGVDFISDNDKVHFASVLAIHKASRTMHVDDTLSWVDLPLVGGLSFHPTLRWALQERAGAADEFCAWALALITQCQEVEHICTAHGRSLTPDGVLEPSIAGRVEIALTEVGSVLDSHKQKYG